MRTRLFIPALGLAAVVYAQAPKTPLTQAEAEASVAAVLPDIQSIRGLEFKA